MGFRWGEFQAVYDGHLSATIARETVMKSRHWLGLYYE
jgi:hypothetical protein